MTDIFSIFRFCLTVSVVLLFSFISPEIMYTVFKICNESTGKEYMLYPFVYIVTSVQRIIQNMLLKSTTVCVIKMYTLKVFILKDKSFNIVLYIAKYFWNIYIKYQLFILILRDIQFTYDKEQLMTKIQTFSA